MSLSPMSSFSPTSAPQTMLPNPSGCGKFVVNVFKAGSGRCRDCGHEWFLHEGVIDKAIAEKFRSIWSSSSGRPSPMASGVPPLPLQSLNHSTPPMRTMREMKEEKKRALLAQRTTSGRNSDDWFNGGDSSARSSRSHIPSFDENNIDSDQDGDDFKFYSREEFVAKNGSSLGSMISSNSKASVKVVNLIDFDNKDMTPPRRVMESSSPRTNPVGDEDVIVSGEKLREMEQLLKQLHADKNSNEEKIINLEKLVIEKDAIVDTAKAESGRLLDELDRVMMESNRKVRELEQLVDQGVEESKKREEIVVGNMRKIETLEARIAHLVTLNDAKKCEELEEVYKQLEMTQSQLSELGTKLEQREKQYEELEKKTLDFEISKNSLETCKKELELSLLKSNDELSILRKDYDSNKNKWEELQKVAASQDAEILKLRKELNEMGESHVTKLKKQADDYESLRTNSLKELSELKERNMSDSNRSNAEIARLRSENEMLTVRLHENSEQLRIERSVNVEVQGRLMRAEETIEELNSRLKRSSDELNSSMRIGNNYEQLRDDNEHYLDAIADVAVVLRTACDKYLTPHSSMANSRAQSLEDIGTGPEAIRVLEMNVKSALRMIDNVYEKCRYLEKENTKLETNMYDLQLINQGLKEKMNKSFVQRLFEPMMSCGLSGNSSPQSGGVGHGSPIVRHYHSESTREMSHLLPPGQVSMLDDPDVH